MNNKLTRFSYNGETVVIYSGNFFSKNELITRLKEMNFLSVDSSYEKRDLICIYDIALNHENNKIKIWNRLKKDTEYFKSKNDLFKKNIYKDESFDRENKSNNIYNYDEDDESISDNGSYKSSFFLKILGFINAHKIDILEKLLYIIIYFSVDAFLKNIAKSNYILGKIINYFRSKVTPRRVLLGFLLYYIMKYILNTLFYFLFGIGILTLAYIIYKDQIKEFLFNIFNI